uniref:AAA_lid_1 domain-containing protein n=1 Tax=Macrostomum lignano TaxID=282301 RepID=A0A1I8FS68_9PLAT
MQFMAAMITPGGGRNAHSNQRLNGPVQASSTRQSAADTIVQDARFLQSEVRALIARLVPLTRRLWQLTKIKMLPTPAKFHYVFNLRDLSRNLAGHDQHIKDVATVFSLWKARMLQSGFLIDLPTLTTMSTWFKRETMSRVVVEDMGEEVGQAVWNRRHYFVDFHKVHFRI